MPPIVALAARRHPEAYAAVIYPLRRGRILSVSRKDTGVLSAVGGKREGAETSLQAAIREAGEEVGVDEDCLLDVQLVYIGVHAGRRIDAFTCVLSWDARPMAMETGTRIGWLWPSQIAQGFGGAFHRKALRRAGLLR